jgi:hypothetical protein
MPNMSYRRRGLGQNIGKQVPGQVNFLSPELAYLQTPGYVEHGSWITGAPDIIAWSRPEGAGLHGERLLCGGPYRYPQPWLDTPSRGVRPGDGLGQTLTDLACSGSALNASWTTRTRDALGAGLQAAIAAGIAAGAIGAVSKRPAIGAVAGLVLAYGAFKTWTAPYVV